MFENIKGETILWHMTQHQKAKWIQTTAFTGGAATLMATPDILPQTTCRFFKLNPRTGCRTDAQSLEVLEANISGKRYIFVDEFSFISYEHLADISDQIRRALGAKSNPDEAFHGLSFIFLGDYHQLSKPGSLSMYAGAVAESTQHPEDIGAWFATMYQNALDMGKRNEFTPKSKRALQRDPIRAFVGRTKWNQVKNVIFLTQQMRQEKSEDGIRLRQRIDTLTNSSLEELPDSFFESIQAKHIGSGHIHAPTKSDLQSPQWKNLMYIVQRHELRQRLDFHEAVLQARLKHERMCIWYNEDTCTDSKVEVPPHLQATMSEKFVQNISWTQYFYRGCTIAFNDNKFFDCRQATNNTAKMLSIVLDPREPQDDFTGPYRVLN